MYFTMVTLACFLLALAARRPLVRLLDLRFRLVGVLWAAIAIRLLFVPGAIYPMLSSHPFPGLPPLGGLLYVLSLLMVVIFAWFNRRILGISVIGLGLMLNALVIGANGGQMPVDPKEAAAAGQLQALVEPEGRGEWSTFALMRPDTPLSLLGDRISVPMPFKEPSILSVGDFVITVGIFLFFFFVPGMERWRVPEARGA